MRYSRVRISTQNLKTKSKKLLTGLTVSAAATTAFALMAGSLQANAAPPTCKVPTATYPTIQSAVDDTTCTTVKVAAGNYHENVSITRSVVLKGAKAGQPVSSRSFGNAAESTVDGTALDTPTFTVNAPNVTISGFSISNPGHGIGVNIKTAGNSATITKNILDTIGSSTYPDSVVGVNLETGPDNVSLSGNDINNVKSTRSAQGVLVGDSTSADPSLNTRIDGNHITNVTSTAKGAYGIQANDGANSTGYSEVKIRGNTISDLTGGWVHAIGLEGKTPNAVVRYNTIQNLNSAGADKVAVYFEDNEFFFTAHVNHNNLAVGSSAFGIAVAPALSAQYPSLTVGGQCNWWGAKNGPGAVASGSGSMVSPGVDYSPWLTSDNLDRSCDKNHNHGQHDGDCGDHKGDDTRGDWTQHDND